MVQVVYVSMLAAIAGVGTMTQPTTRPADDAVETVTIRAGDLEVVFRDNSKSPGLLSGLDSLVNSADATGFDAFDPDDAGASAGLNFEHIISGHPSPHNKFTPRHGRYTLHPLADGKSVQLRRRAEDSPWAMESTFTYTVVEPHCIDFAFRCKPHDAKRFGKRGYAIFFFADYMNDVVDPAIHFRGVAREGGKEKWIVGDASLKAADWNTGGTWRHVEVADDLTYDDDVQFRLNHWSYDWPRFTKPFYYGKAAHDMTYILMFDRTSSEVDQIRFSLFTFKLKKHPRPAWDFQYVINKVQTGKEYGFNGRAVWKRFVSPEDCLAEYEKWKGKKGRYGKGGRGSEK